MKTGFKVLTTAITLSIALIGCSNKKFAHQQNNPSTNFQGIPDLFNGSNGIIGGTEVTPNDPVAPYIVGIYDIAKSTLCTGSIIDSNIILTAAHCISADSSNMIILFGPSLKDAKVSRKVDFAGANAKYLPQDEESDWNDIGIIHMQGTLPDGYKPAEMLSTPFKIETGANALLAGYGLADGVNHKGAGVLRQVAAPVYNAEFMKGEVIIDQRQGVGACHGDSGGPAYLQTESGLKLWGVTSRGYHDEKNDCSQFSVYTNSQAYLDWINDSKTFFNLSFATSATADNSQASTDSSLNFKDAKEKQKMLNQLKAKLFLSTAKLKLN